MRKQRLNIIIFLLIVVGFFACMKSEPQGEDIPRYFYTDEIVNPPDNFYLIFSLSRASVVSHITFETNAVWEVKRGSGGNFTIDVERTVNVDNPEYEPFEIMNTSTTINYIGFEGDVEYRFTAQKPSTNNDDYSVILVQFTKTERDYTEFSPKI